jgi:hypothetical protein
VSDAEEGMDKRCEACAVADFYFRALQGG